MAYIRVDEKVLRAVLEENERLLAKERDRESAPLATAIQKSLENAHTLGVDNTVSTINQRLVDDTMRKAFAAPRDVVKSKKTAAAKKQVHLDEGIAARGLKKSRYSKDGR